MINSTYKPVSVSDFDASKLNFAGKHVKSQIEAGQTSNIDLTLTDDHLLHGMWVIVSGGNFGDTVKFQIVDASGVLAAPGTVLNEFVDWAVPAQTAMQFDTPYPAKIFAGLTLRVVYQSTGTQPVSFAINYKLHKVLV